MFHMLQFSALKRLGGDLGCPDLVLLGRRGDRSGPRAEGGQTRSSRGGVQTVAWWDRKPGWITALEDRVWTPLEDRVWGWASGWTGVSLCDVHEQVSGP